MHCSLEAVRRREQWWRYRTTLPYDGITRIRFKGFISPRFRINIRPRTPNVLRLTSSKYGIITRFYDIRSRPVSMIAQMDFEHARFNMVEQQIRPWDVLDQRVLDLLLRVRREDYVPEAYRALAFADLEIPLGHGEKMLQPKLEARMLQELTLKETDRILEVGTGSGYMTALLASLSQHVCSVEIIPEFSASAGARLAAHAIANLTLEVGDAARGWDKHGPYDAIVLTASVPILPEAFQNSLKPGGG